MDPVSLQNAWPLLAGIALMQLLLQKEALWELKSAHSPQGTKHNGQVHSTLLLVPSVLLQISLITSTTPPTGKLDTTEVIRI